MYLTIIILPLLSSIISGFFGRKVGTTGAQIISCLSLLTITLLSILAFIEVGMNNIPVNIKLFSWIDSESLNILWSFRFDSLTVSMLIPVLVVSSLVHLYSIGYMSHDPHNQRFFSYLSLFTFMMIILVTGNNYLVMFVGWEGVGVCSYLLVNFWYTRIAANQSALSAFLTNRVGDCLLTIGMFALILTFGNLDYSTIFSIAPYVSENAIVFIGICLLIGAMAKSSQIGLHIWLPMAMEGPTPVSALIHAATMVTAGVYLLMRSSPLIEYSNTVLLTCLWIGAVTTVFSSLIGLFQQDIKKVIAYSTMSQLGMMVISVGLSSYNLALFHLMNHAFYKALLFLGAGAVIHAVSDNQDFRKYGGLRSFLPLTYSVMLIASLSLVAFPFMTGYYSKDFIIESAYGQFTFSGISIYCISTIAAMFTTLYSVKVLYLTFITNPNGPLVSYKNAHEGDIFMSIPLMILAVFSVFFGYVFKDAFIGLGSAFFVDNSIFIHPLHEITLDTEFAVPTIFKLIPLIFTLTLTLIFILLSEFTYILSKVKLSRLGYNIYGFFNQRFFIELFYNTYITNVVLKLGGLSTKIVDKGSIELIGPYGLERGLTFLSKFISNLDTKIVTSYALYILVGLALYVLMPYYYSIDSNIFIVLLLGLFSFSSNSTKYPLYDNIHYKKKSSLYTIWTFLYTKLCFMKYIIIYILYIVKWIVMLLGLDVGFMDITIEFAKNLFEGNLSFSNNLFALNSGNNPSDPMDESDDNTDMEAEPDLMTDMGSEPEPMSESDDNTNMEPEPMSESDSNTDMEAEPDLMSDIGSESEPISESDADMEPESQSESESGSISGSERGLMTDADQEEHNAYYEEEARARVEAEYEIYSDDKSNKSGAVSDSSSEDTVSEEKIAATNQRVEEFIKNIDKDSKPLDETYTDPDTDSKSPDFNNPFNQDSDCDYSRGVGKCYRKDGTYVEEYRVSALEFRARQKDGTYKSLDLDAQGVEQHFRDLEQSEMDKFDKKLKELNFDNDKLRELSSEWDKTRDDYENKRFGKK